MGNSSKKQIYWELACNKCFTHYLVELISYEDIFLIRKYCFCPEETLSAGMSAFYYMKLKTNYYQSSEFHTYKYCYTCNEFIEDTKLLNHLHNTLINADDYIYNCKLHKNEILIGFCKSCKQLICGMCINKNLHKNHKIEYTTNLEITEEIMNKYETNLQKAYLEMNNLLKLKYKRKDLKLKMRNIFEEVYDAINYYHFDSKDERIISILKLLKTFIDLYKSHKKNHRIINYQILSNILNHTNFEILRIEGDKRYTNNINIIFKIDLFPEKNNDKRFEIISFREKKILTMKIIKKDLYFFVLNSISKCIIFIYKNFKESENYIELDDEVYNFVILENDSLVIYTPCKLLIYKFSKDIFNFEKKININFNENTYHILNYLGQNNFSFFIHDKDKHTISLQFYIYPDYKESNLLLQESQTKPINGTSKQINNKIIIAIDYYFDKLYKIFIFDLTTKEIKCIKMKNLRTYYSSVEIFEIDFNKVLISFQGYGLIFNIKEMQIETKINKGGLACLHQIGDYLLTSSDDYIYQFDRKKGKIYNKIKLLFDAYYFTFNELIDIGDNYFCGVSHYKIIYLFKYK